MMPKGSATTKGPLIWDDMMQLQEGCQGQGAAQWCRAGSGFSWWRALLPCYLKQKKDSSMMRTIPEASLHMMHPRIMLAMGWQV